MNAALAVEHRDVTYQRIDVLSENLVVRR